MNYQALNLSDEQLSFVAQKGDKAAETVLVSRYISLVKSRAAFFRGNFIESEDLAQEGLIGLLNAIRKYDNKAGAVFSTFAYLCINRRMLTALKKAKNVSKKNSRVVSEVISLNDLSGSENPGGHLFSDPQDSFLNIDFSQLCSELKKSLSPLEYQVLIFYLGGYSYSEISKNLGTTFKVVDNAMQRVRRKLR